MDVFRRSTKLVATLGPSEYGNYDVVRRMAYYVDGFRINFSHGSLEEWRWYVEAVRKVESELGRPMPIIGDLKGPGVRFGEVEKPLTLQPGERLILSLDGTRGVRVPHEEFFEIVEVGDVILSDDGRAKFRVVERGAKYVVVEAQVRCSVKSKKALVVVGKEYPHVLPTPYDVDCLKHSVELGLDYIAISHVRDSEDVKRVRKIVEELGGGLGLIAKIENFRSVENFEYIAREVDYVMIARGDLGLHYGLESVPRIQWELTRRGLELGVPIMVATQFLESMVHEVVPTRAEVNDVYTAVLQGVDSILLTQETAVGEHPVEVVEWADAIIKRAEEVCRVEADPKTDDVRDLFARGIVHLSKSLNSDIVIYTKSGLTARRLAKYRPSRPIHAVTSSLRVARRISLLRGVYADVIPQELDYDEGLKKAFEKVRGRIASESVICTYGMQREALHKILLINMRLFRQSVE